MTYYLSCTFLGGVLISYHNLLTQKNNFIPCIKKNVCDNLFTIRICSYLPQLHECNYLLSSEYDLHDIMRDRNYEQYLLECRVHVMQI